MILVEAVRIGGGGQGEGLRDGGKVERNRRQQDDHQWDIVLVLVTKIAYIACPLFLPHPLAWLSRP